MADVIKTTFKVKRGTAARWEELNLILNPGEPGFEMDTFKLKIGNGSTPWKELPYVNDIDVASIQPDWNQNDSTQPDYVKNRPFYTGAPVETVLVEESTVSFSISGSGIYTAALESTFSLTVGDIYKISWDGSVYECTCVSFPDNMKLIGNPSIMGDTADTGEPFIIVDSDQGVHIGTLDTSPTHTISISQYSSGEVVKIDEKFIPDVSSLTIKSSTAGSTKKFRITVDDSGTITATEVT